MAAAELQSQGGGGVGRVPTRPQGATHVSLFLWGAGHEDTGVRRTSGKSRLQHKHFRLKINLVHISLPSLVR